MEGEPKSGVISRLLAAVVFGVQMGVQRSVMSVGMMLTWLVGAAVFVVVVSVVLSGRAISSQAERLGLLLAAWAVVLQGQIDMGFFHQGSQAVCWLIVGVAGGCGVVGERAGSTWRRRRVDVFAALVFLVGAVGLAYPTGWRVTEHQRAMRSAAQAWREGDLRQAVHGLDRASHVMPGDLAAYRRQVSVLLELAHALHEAGRGDEANAVVHRVLALLDEPFAHGVDTASYWRLRARVQEQAAALLGEPGRLGRAVRAWENVVARSPYSIGDHLALADELWSIGEKQAAQAEYRKCLELSELSYLDPARQLHGEDRLRVERRSAGR